MPKFVILRHEPGPQSDRVLHWDLMLEAEQCLKTWALSAEPADDAAMTADALPDHRMKYLDYEGPLSGDRGQVTLWDSGSYEFEQPHTEQHHTEQHHTDLQFTVRLRGNRVPAWATFSRRDVRSSNWLIEFYSDAIQARSASE